MIGSSPEPGHTSFHPVWSTTVSGVLYPKAPRSSQKIGTSTLGVTAKHRAPCLHPAQGYLGSAIGEAQPSEPWEEALGYGAPRSHTTPPCPPLFRISADQASSLRVEPGWVHFGGSGRRPPGVLSPHFPPSPGTAPGPWDLTVLPRPSSWPRPEASGPPPVPSHWAAL